MTRAQASGLLSGRPAEMAERFNACALSDKQRIVENRSQRPDRVADGRLGQSQFRGDRASAELAESGDSNS